MSDNSLLILGQIIHCLALNELEVIPDGFIIISSNGKILAVGNKSDLAKTESALNVTTKRIIQLKKTQLLLPGLIDTHIHAPQYPNVGLGYDKPLLEWLNLYTYNLEKQYSNDDLSEKVYNAVVRKTLDHGTTTACYFGSLFFNSTIILAQAVNKHGQRALVGKINMTKLAPDDYIETREESLLNTRKFIESIRSLENPLIQPVITPRFALSVDAALMAELGKLAEAEDLHIQTHISENKTEVQMVRNLFNDSYANVYHVAKLLTHKTILAHGIHLTDDEIKLIAQTGTSIAHCPESNTNLASGLCDVRKLQEGGVNVGLGTDVAGGASPSIIAAMKSAISASTHLSFTKDENYKPLDYSDVFYLATLGGAKALALQNEIGNFVVGKSFDGIIVDLDVKGSSADYLTTSATPHELLQKFVFLGDNRNVINVFVNGKQLK